jgi:hypothetical protein
MANRYLPIEHALVERGEEDPADHWVGLVVVSRWELDGTAEEGCYLEQLDEDWNGELEAEEWFPSVEAARRRAAELFRARLGNWRPGLPTRDAPASSSQTIARFDVPPQ